MLILALICGLFFIIGALLGKWLANKGITPNINLSQYQNLILGILVCITLFVLGLVLVDKLNLTQKLSLLIPNIILLYLGAYIYHCALIFGVFIMGLLIFLEFSQTKQKNIAQLFSALILISLPLTLIIHFLWPITNQFGSPKIINNIVLQTTDYTCAPSAIATLARFTGKNPQLSEREAVLLTNTNRRGTSTLMEIRAMKKLGLNPEYRRGLTTEDLLEINKPAILHVKEKIGSRVVPHAIALLSVNPENKTLEIANPLYGKQQISIEDMKGYWYGEAVLVKIIN